MIRKSKRAIACDVSPETRKAVLERDGHKCIFCGRKNGLTMAHCISRAQGGLGILENLVTACLFCHRRLDQTSHRENYMEGVVAYLCSFYPDFDNKKRIYKKDGAL